MNRWKLLVIASCLYYYSNLLLADILDQRFSPSLHNSAISSWKKLRSKDVILQELDFSCGAASLATLLSSYFGLKVTEKDVIDIADKGEWFSFADLQFVMQRYGFKGIGLALNFDQLKELKLPAIVYIETRSGPHFAVLRGISDDIVLLADPALGNSKLPVSRFLEIWNTRKKKRFKGKILVALPSEGTAVKINQKFFSIPEKKGLSMEQHIYNKRLFLITP